MAGAAAAEGKSLEEVYDIASRFNEGMATLAATVKTADETTEIVVDALVKDL